MQWSTTVLQARIKSGLETPQPIRKVRLNVLASSFAFVLITWGEEWGKGRGQSEDSREYVLSFLIYFIFGSRKFGRSTARRSTFYVQTCIFGVTDLKLSYFLFLIFHRRHRYKLYLPTSKSNIRPNTYPYRSSSVYMERTRLARNWFNSLVRFKSSLTSDQLLRHCKVSFT